MADVVENDGSIDSAANAIFALMEREKTPQPEPPVAAAPAPEPDHVPDPAPVEGAEIPEQPNPDEEAAPAEAPVEASQEEPTPPVAHEAPKPAEAAPKVAEPAENPQLKAVTERLQTLNALVPQLEARLVASFPDIKTFDDLEKLAAEDPARYFQYDVQNKRLMEARQHQAAASSEYRAHWMQQEAVKLGNLLPEWNDPAKGPALKEQLTKFAREVGFSERQIAQAGASDIILLRDAMLFRESKAREAAAAAAHAKALKEAKAKAADAPPVQKPGAQRPKDTGDKAKEARDRLRKTGDVDDAARVFALLG